MPHKIQQIKRQNQEAISRLFTEHWGDEKIILHRAVFQTAELSGLKAVENGEISRSRIERKMKSLRKFITLILLVITMLGGCAPFSSQETPSPATGTPGSTLPETADRPSQAEPIRTDSGGPFLLVQTAVDGYSIIDFADLSITPFDPPGPDQEYRLAENLSPSGTQMLFPVSKNETLVYAFSTESTLTIAHLDENSESFQPERAASAAREALPGLKYSDEALLNAVNHAFQQSITSIQWFKSDRYLLTVQIAGETSTQLVLDDRHTGKRTPLEGQPALVEEFWVGPMGEKILLKKGFMFEPGVWQDDHYYLVDVRQGQADPIILPDDADNPRVFWFSQDYIGIIHQPAPVGGVGFSVIDTHSLAAHQFVSGAFSGAYPFSSAPSGTHILTIYQDLQANFTRLERKDDQGEIFNTKDLNQLCSVFTRVDENRYLLNCDEESLILQRDTFAILSFREPIFLFAQSPDRGRIVLVENDLQSNLLNTALDVHHPLDLAGDPAEIRWLPDSSGFLYRTSTSLYLYQLSTQTSTFLLESDLFGDYRNLNAVWMHLNQ